MNDLAMNRDVESGVHVRHSSGRRYQVQVRVGNRSVSEFRKYDSLGDAIAHGEMLWQVLCDNQAPQ